MAKISPFRKVKDIDGNEVRIIEKTDDKYVIRYKIESFEEWSAIVTKKQKLYGIQIEEQITSFDDSKKILCMLEFLDLCSHQCKNIRERI